MRAFALVGVALLSTLSGSAAAVGVPGWRPPVVEGQLSLAAGEGGNELQTADLNGDGLRDVILGPRIYDRVEPVPPVFLLNKGGGRFVEATSSLFDGPAPKVEWNREMVVADFNGDGRPDIFIADHGSDNQTLNPGYPGQQDRLILSTPDGKYTDATANLPQQWSFTHSAAAADVNGDGHVDIFENNLSCCGRDHSPAEILLNDGTGHFTAAPGLLHGFPLDQYGHDHSYACAFVDVNGDGHPDLVLGGNDAVERSVVLLNDGHGNFNYFERLPPKLYGPGNGIVIDIAAADVNGDGHIDLLMAETQLNPYYIGSKIQVLINDGKGHFTDETKTRLPDQPNGRSWPDRLRMEDFNDDGRLDLAIQYETAGVPEIDPTPFWLNENGVFTRIAGGKEGSPSNSRGPVAFVNGDGPHAFFSVEWNGGGRYYVAAEILPPAAPTGLTGESVPAGIRISWQAVTGATSYTIARATPRTRFARIGATTRTTFTDRTAKPGRTYRYTVQARNGPATSAPSAVLVRARRARR